MVGKDVPYPRHAMLYTKQDQLLLFSSYISKGTVLTGPLPSVRDTTASGMAVGLISISYYLAVLGSAIKLSRGAVLATTLQFMYMS